MLSETDKNWIAEQKRVEEVIELIKQKKEKLSERKGELKEGVIGLRKDFWEDVTVNLDEPDDVIETQASLKQQAELLSERERSHGQLSEQLKTLDRLEDSPYFGRIDFQQNDEAAAEKIYIGIASLMDQKEEDFLVYDWRAPISSLYYDYAPGPAEYETVDGIITGEMTVKRQYIIRNSKLKGMFDTGLTIGDHLLQAVLGDNANTQMKSIVATIQQEQNQIIRNEKSNLLVVQGVAGSGKTSAALQRVAYLLYRHRETLKSDNIILFSPNPLFNSYVATVLPELGEENMQQATFYDYVKARLGRQFHVESPFAQTEYYLASSDSEAYRIRVAGIDYKASLAYKKLIDEHVRQLGKTGLVFKHVTFRGTTIAAKEEITDYFYGLDQAISIPNRMDLTAKWLLKKVNDYAREQVSEDWVLDETQLLDKEEFLQVYQQMEAEDELSDDPFFDFVKEEELLRKKVVADNFRPLKKKVKRMYFLNARKSFQKLFQQEAAAVYQEAVPEQWNAIAAQTVEQLEQGIMRWEDGAPYLYFQNMLVGFQVNRNIRHVFIDEAQDYSPFHFALFQKLFPSSNMTLLGDINQTIYAHALHQETVLADEEGHGHERIVLTRSYRSTKPIVEFTKAFMPEGDRIEAFNRDGSKPRVLQMVDKKQLHSQLMTQVTAFKAAGHETIAVICKTKEESLAAYDRLKQETDVKLMDEATFTFQKGLVVIPAYLAKGIEFDAVLIYDGSNENYDSELERNIFYTACTRAMHDLVIYTVGTPNRFIRQIPSHLYKTETIIGE